MPSQPQYVIRKTNPDTNNLIRFEISELIQDYIDVVFNDDYTISGSGLSNIKSTCWFYYVKRNTYSDRDAQEFYGYGIGTKGYTYFEDGLNSILSTSKLFSNNIQNNINNNNTIEFLYSYKPVLKVHIEYLNNN